MLVDGSRLYREASRGSGQTQVLITGSARNANINIILRFMNALHQKFAKQEQRTYTGRQGLCGRTTEVQTSQLPVKGHANLGGEEEAGKEAALHALHMRAITVSPVHASTRCSVPMQL